MGEAAVESVFRGSLKVDLVIGAVIGSALYAGKFLLETSQRPTTELVFLLLLAALAGAAGYSGAGFLVRLVARWRR